ncbi:GntR family transcriptional regulator [Labrys sp. WJW]|uniref:GntR family transcriptional regulator n=1 Tax=Labrys sp. WJW TaxID=1737983 RepID=UPI0008367ACB|nr:GntR family transcriptional regulator [Labrys sp. WJW]OCC03653.1 GntR family transcriptional regulator [Labrys sp. WJW]
MTIERPIDLPTSAGLDRKAALGEALRQRILTMRLAPGAVLDEVALAEEFGLSRPPVREVMRQMAGEGYIELEPNRPARVTAMNYQSLRDFFLVAPMIYMVTTKLAAENASKSEIEHLKKIQQNFRRAAMDGDIEARIFSNNEFHLEIGHIGHNAYLIPSLRRLLIDHGRIGRTFFRNDPEAKRQLELAISQHDEIIEAIERHDPDEAMSIVRAHMDLSRRNMAAYAMPDGIEMPLNP